MTETTTTQTVPPEVLEAEQFILRSRAMPEELRQVVTSRGYTLVEPRWVLESRIHTDTYTAFRALGKGYIGSRITPKFLAKEEVSRVWHDVEVEYQSFSPEDLSYLVGKLGATSHHLSESGSLYVLIPAQANSVEVTCIELQRSTRPTQEGFLDKMSAPMESTLEVILSSYGIRRQSSGRMAYEAKRSLGGVQSKVVPVVLSSTILDHVMRGSVNSSGYSYEAPVTCYKSESMMDVYERLVSKSGLVTLKSVGLNNELEYIGDAANLLDPVFKGLVSYVQSYPDKARERNDADVPGVIHAIVEKHGYGLRMSKAKHQAECHLQKLYLEKKLIDATLGLPEDLLLVFMSKLQRLMSNNSDVVRELLSCKSGDFLGILKA